MDHISAKYHGARAVNNGNRFWTHILYHSDKENEYLLFLTVLLIKTVRTCIGLRTSHLTVKGRCLTQEMSMLYCMVYLEKF